MRAWKKKIKSPQGETITETMVALLIIVLALTMLAGSIVSSARVNRKVEDIDTSFTTTGAAASDGTVTLTHANGQPADSVNVKVYTTADDNAYIYYEKAD